MTTSRLTDERLTQLADLCSPISHEEVLALLAEVRASRAAATTGEAQKACHVECDIGGVAHVCNRAKGHPPPHLLDLFRKPVAVEPGWLPDPSLMAVSCETRTGWVGKENIPVEVRTIRVEPAAVAAPAVHALGVPGPPCGADPWDGLLLTSKPTDVTCSKCRASPPPGSAADADADARDLAILLAPGSAAPDKEPEDRGLAPPGDLRAELAGWRRLASSLPDDDPQRVTLYRCASRIESHLSAGSAAPADPVRARCREIADRLEASMVGPGMLVVPVREAIRDLRSMAGSAAREDGAPPGAVEIGGASPICMCGDYRDGYHGSDGRCLRPGCLCEGFIDAALLHGPSWAKEAAASLDAMGRTTDLGSVVVGAHGLPGPKEETALREQIVALNCAAADDRVRREEMERRIDEKDEEHVEHRASAENVVRALVARGRIACSICQDKPATCAGSYEDGPIDFGCDDCCGHGNEDGWCVPLAGSAAREDGAPDLALYPASMWRKRAGDLAEALRGVLASAVPNPREHPTMTRAWKQAAPVLAAYDASRAAPAPGAAPASAADDAGLVSCVSPRWRAPASAPDDCAACGHARGSHAVLSGLHGARTEACLLIGGPSGGCTCPGYVAPEPKP